MTQQLDGARLLWALRSTTGRRLTATIMDGPLGRALQLRHARDILETFYSFFGDDPLLSRADQIRGMLEKDGWTADDEEAQAISSRSAAMSRPEAHR